MGLAERAKRSWGTILSNAQDDENNVISFDPQNDQEMQDRLSALDLEAHVMQCRNDMFAAMKEQARVSKEAQNSVECAEDDYARALTALAEHQREMGYHAHLCSVPDPSKETDEIPGGD